VSRKVIAGIAAALAAVVIVAIAIASRGDSSPAQHAPLHVKPAQQFGDDADLMRRLERKKLTTTTTR
jgi:hypothetical protein